MRGKSILAALVVGAAIVVALGVGRTNGGGTAAAAPSSCTFKNGIKHVIYLQFDNTHYRRDAASVPSDLEQMPHLLNFLKGNGTSSRTTTRS